MQGDRLAGLDLRLDGLGGGVDPFRDHLHLLLDLGHQVLDLLGALLRGLGQGAHLVRHHGKSLAVLAGAGGLDRRVQCEEVGLIGDAHHRLDDVADVGGLFFQFHHHLHRGGLTFGGHPHVGDQAADVVAGPLGERLDRLGLCLAYVGVLQLTGDRQRHLLEGRERLLCRSRRLFRAGADLLGVAFQLLGRGGGLVDTGRELSGGRRYALRRLLLLCQRARSLAQRFRIAAGNGRGLAAGRSGDEIGGFFHEGHGGSPLSYCWSLYGCTRRVSAITGSNRPAAIFCLTLASARYLTTDIPDWVSVKTLQEGDFWPTPQD